MTGKSGSSPPDVPRAVGNKNADLGFADHDRSLDPENSTDHDFYGAAGRPQSRSPINQKAAFHSRSSEVVFGGTDVKRSLWGWMLFCILSTSLPIFSQTATTSLRGT